MRLTWLGTASLLLEADDMILAFDPFPGIPLRGKFPQERPLPDEALYRRATAVIATHGHVDHIYYIPALYGDLDTPVYCTAAPRRTLARAGMAPARLRLIAPGWEDDFGPVHIRAWQSLHCRFDGPLIRKTVFRKTLWAHMPRLFRILCAAARCTEGGETLFYELADGSVRVQLMGSMNLCPDIEYPRGADHLILPFQGRSDIDEYALRIVERLRPKSILLDHYDDTFPPLSAEIPTENFCRLVKERCGIPCRPLQKYETIHLEKAVT